MNDPIDFGIVVALDIELKAVLNHLGRNGQIERIEHQNRTYYVAEFSTKESTVYKIAVTSPLQAGNTPAALCTRDLIERWSPSFVVMVGIAAGLQPKSQHFGEVIVAESVVYYEMGKVRAEGQEQRPVSFPSASLLLNRAKAFSGDWQSRISTAIPRDSEAGPKSRVHTGPIASGEKVLADRQFIQGLLRLHPKLVGAEMESYGVASAAHNAHPPSGFLAVRGISDFGDASKSDDWQQYAADAAAAWLTSFLETAPVQVAHKRDSSKNRIRSGENGTKLRWKGVQGRQFMIRTKESFLITSRGEGGPIPVQESSHSHVTSRELMATVSSVRPSGAFSVHLVPVTHRCELIVPGAKLFAEERRSPRTDSGVQQSSGVVYGNVAQADLEYLLHVAQEVNRIAVDLEITPRGVVVRRSSSRSPFSDPLPKGVPSTQKSQYEMVQWLGSGTDISSWIAGSSILSFPESPVSAGEGWGVRRKVDIMGLAYEGVTEAILQEFEKEGLGVIAHIEESGELPGNAHGFSKFQEAALRAQFPDIRANTRETNVGPLKLKSTWAFDVSQGELISRECHQMSQDLVSQIEIQDSYGTYSIGVAVESSGTFTINCVPV